LAALAESPDGKWLASVKYSGVLKLWPTSPESESITLEEPVLDAARAAALRAAGLIRGNPPVVVWSPDSKHLAATSKYETTIRVWNPATREPALTFRGHGKAVRSMAWSPDSKFLASAGLDGTFKVWNLQNGKEIVSQPFFLKDETGISRGKPEVFSILAWSNDSKWLAVAEENSTIRIWDVAIDKTIVILDGHQGELFAVAWSPDGKRLASGSTNGSFILWDVATFQPILTLHPMGWPNGGGGTLSWSPDGWQLGFFGERGAVTLWDATPKSE
jgi:WD40 repeat protein